MSDPNLPIKYPDSDTREMSESLGMCIDMLLRRLDQRLAFHLRLCAIPHGLNLSLFRALIPNMDAGEAERDYKIISRFSIIKIIPHGQSGFQSERIGDADAPGLDPHRDALTMHSEARRYLFNQWLSQENRADFIAASARLARYYDQSAFSSENRIGPAVDGTYSEVLAGEASEGAENKSVQSEKVEAERMFHLIGADREAGFKTFERLYHHRREEFRLGDCEYLLRLVHEYDKVLGPALRSRLIYHEGKLALDRHQLNRAEMLFTDALTAAPVDAFGLQVRTLVRLGTIEAEKRQWPEAINLYKKALSLAEAIDDSHERETLSYRILRDLGVAYRDSGDLEQAEENLQKSILLAERVDSLAGQAQGYNSVATLYRQLGETELAIEKYERSLSFLERLNDNFRPAQVYNNIGLTYLNSRAWDMSLKFFEKSLTIKRQAGDSVGQAKTLNNLVQAYSNLGRDGEAIENAQHAAKIFEEVQDYYDAALVNRNLGRLYRRTSMKDDANKYYSRAVELLEKSIKNERLEVSLGFKSGAEWTTGQSTRVKTREMRLIREVEAIKEEIREFNRRFWLPWWMWLSIITLLLFLLWFLKPLIAEHTSLF